MLSLLLRAGEFAASRRGGGLPAMRDRHVVAQAEEACSCSFIDERRPLCKKSISCVLLHKLIIVGCSVGSVAPGQLKLDSTVHTRKAH